MHIKFCTIVVFLNPNCPLLDVNASVATLDQLVTNGFLFQELPLSNNSVELFSMKANLIVGDGSVCALVFLNGNKIPVAVSAPLRY